MINGSKNKNRNRKRDVESRDRKIIKSDIKSNEREKKTDPIQDKLVLLD